MVRSLGLKAGKIILMGDSGGDGPHFQWGAKSGAFMIGSMTKPSLDSYCREKEIMINLRFGLDYSKGKKKDQTKESGINFMDLTTTIEAIVHR